VHNQKLEQRVASYCAGCPYVFFWWENDARPSREDGCDADLFVSVHCSLMFSAALKDAGASATVNLYQGKTHTDPIIEARERGVAGTPIQIPEFLYDIE
jgi:hypothetical protein